ncbi:alcohol dehydrogenase [Pseudomonas syringae]|uniref:zinc-binding dehydrogenase n=1 Tax=Pseudomonas syringae group TaxID=136849 RepID=UPI0008967937|nr:MULTISPECIES: zinc-binding dehydrogenase [Pseudomonas syringae group]RMN43889.1 hypothetical protein ALQ59_01558 [Pseudomonas syringae pv. apii]RMN51238.1 hypothetical protein ALQ58_01048 [Pseudomonas syringae pv. apii]SDZ50968.1 alcohol dehydrogenase [Pseudomonas syringae]
MKAFFINRYGKSSGELPEPKVGGNDVLVQIHAASINPLDLKIRTGEFKQILPYTFPLILGNDLAGVVVRAVLLSDALPTAHEIGVQYGNVQPGDTIAVIGAGPVGMGCVLTAQLYSPSSIIVIDMDDNRLAMARELGATHTINSAHEDAIARVLEITEGRGVDCAIEAVGLEATWNICQHIVKEGGHIANVGVHGKPVQFALEKLWIKNLTITTGLVNANTTSMLLKTCCSGKLPMEKLATHTFGFSELPKAYDVFKHAADEKAMKVMIDF